MNPREHPKVGDVFAVPFADGRFGAVRVIRVSKEDGEPNALVAVTTWIAHHAPNGDEPELKQTLRCHRGFFGGRPALAWYTGAPPFDMALVGSLPPTPADLAIDPEGTYAGDWSPSMADDVFLEAQFAASLDTSSKVHGDIGGTENHERPDNDETEVDGAMSEDEFWDVIDLLDSAAANEQQVVQPVVRHLAELDLQKIGGFQRMLCDRLYQLDGETFARQIGEFAYGGPGGFSPDHFLDVRCAVVAAGRQYYEAVLRDPSLMPRDGEFEPLMAVAKEAYRRKTGVTPVFADVSKCETFANAAGWLSDTQ